MKLPFIGNMKLVSKSSWTDITKKISEYDTAQQIRPVASFFNNMGPGGRGSGSPLRNVVMGYNAYFQGIQVVDMQELALLSSVYAQAVNALQWEIFRNGGKFEPRFESKCSNPECAKEFDFQVEECDACDSITVGPNYEQLEPVKKFWKKCNQSQSVLDVCKEAEADIDTLDDIFIIVGKEYSFNSEGEIIHEKTRPTELLRANPAVMGMITDRELKMGYDAEGRPVFTCPVHRNQEFNTPGKCPVCGLKKQPAWYVSDSFGLSTGKNKGEKVYYIPGEVIHASKYHPGLGRGVPPFLSVYQKVMIELGQDWYIRKSYDKGRPPNSWLFVKTANVKSLQKVVEWVEGMLQKNPHSVVPIGVETNANGNFVNHVDMLKSQQEMQAVEYRNIIKREIGARLGVMPLFQGDMSNSGGLNNEGLQVTVTNRAVGVGQNVWNDIVFPEIFNAFGVTDFRYVLNPSEEKDEMAELQRQSLEIDNMLKMNAAGFDVELNDDNTFDFGGAPDPALAGLPGLGPGSQFQDNKLQGASGAPDSIKLAEKARLSRPVRELRTAAGVVSRTLEQELDKLVEALKLKNRVSKASMKKRVDALVAKFGERSRKKINSEIKGIYLAVQDEVGKELNRNILFEGVDKNAVELLSSSRPLSVAYEGMTEKMSGRINEVIAKAYEEPGALNITQIVSDMREAADVSESDLRRIARTETTQVSNAARENSYSQSDPEGKNKYKWTGPNDNRRTDICKEITARSRQGVSMVELKRLVVSVPKKYGTSAIGKLVPHINCRHTVIKVV